MAQRPKKKKKKKMEDKEIKLFYRRFIMQI